jgi:hypothetical protein
LIGAIDVSSEIFITAPLVSSKGRDFCLELLALLAQMPETAIYNNALSMLMKNPDSMPVELWGEIYNASGIAICRYG